MALTYAQQLKDPRWQRRRLEKLSAAGFACDFCGDANSELHVHHPEYYKGRKAWEYSDDELEVLCKPCHGRHHELETAIKLGKQRNCLGGRFLDAVIAGMLDCSLDLEVSDEALADICPDGRLTGAIAHLFFFSKATTKRAVALALLRDAGQLNPAQASYLREYMEEPCA